MNNPSQAPAGPPATGPETSTNMEWHPIKPSLTRESAHSGFFMWEVSLTHPMVAGGYFMWEVSLPHLVLAALCGKFLLEKKKAIEIERESV